MQMIPLLGDHTLNTTGVTYDHDHDLSSIFGLFFMKHTINGGKYGHFSKIDIVIQYLA
jgi:hypothetical protein